MRTRHNPLFHLLNRDYYENFDLYVPRLADFHELVANKLPSGWNISRHGIWFQCASAQNILPDQGWKIHVSATRTNARAILDRVSSILFTSADVDFKFALDVPALCLLNGKNWPRSASGKFITIYPSSNSRFLELIEQLHAATSEFQGPYVLTDHRYKDSHVVFYRYGGMKRRDALDITGEAIPMLVAPDGTNCPDHRRPYPETPAWAESVVPLQQDIEDVNEHYLVGDGRFRITGVIGFSSSGGVYRGNDLRTGAPVIIKEARPYIEVSDGHDAITLLKKEHRLLTLLADTGIAPQPVDLFQEGTHWFLVEEYVEGLPLSSHSASHNILLRTRPSEDDFQDWYRTFRQLSRRLLEIIEVLRSRNVVFSDLSPGNLIVTEGGKGLRLIDFEGAHQLDVDQPSSLYTPGFVSQRRRQGGGAGFEDDRYSAGAVLLSYLLPVSEFFHLQLDARDRFLQAIQKDARLPDAVPEMILTLMQEDAQPETHLTTLAEHLPPDCIAEQEPDNAIPDYKAVTEAVVQHLLQSATYHRSDRLFPADPKLFVTNPLSLAYGACGVAYAIKKITGSVPRPVVDWILKQPIKTSNYAPGLYLGLSGIAWALLELGERQRAEEVFQLTLNDNLLTHSSDLFYGEAGWAMTSLRFFLDTGNELYLQKAISCGNRLLATADSVATDSRKLGLAHGASGTALFLLYLYLISGEERFIAEGKRLLENDLSAGVLTRDGGLSWKPAVNAPNSLYPFWRSGSAGVGAAVLRYQKVLGNGSYKNILNAIFVDTDRKHALLPGRFSGLAGIGDFLLDAWEFTGDKKYLASAHQAAEGILRFSVARNGTAFPGESLGRLSCDYGTGSAGIAVFLNRLLGRQGSDFLLDELLDLTACNSQVHRREGPARRNPVISYVRQMEY